MNTMPPQRFSVDAEVIGQVGPMPALLLAILVAYRGDDGTTVLTQQELASAAGGISLDSVQRHLGALAEAGLIKAESQYLNHRQRASRYQVISPAGPVDEGKPQVGAGPQIAAPLSNRRDKTQTKEAEDFVAEINRIILLNSDPHTAPFRGRVCSEWLGQQHDSEDHYQQRKACEVGPFDCSPPPPKGVGGSHARRHPADSLAPTKWEGDPPDSLDPAEPEDSEPYPTIPLDSPLPLGSGRTYPHHNYLEITRLAFWVVMVHEQLLPARSREVMTDTKRWCLHRKATKVLLATRPCLHRVFGHDDLGHREYSRHEDKKPVAP